MMRSTGPVETKVSAATIAAALSALAIWAAQTYWFRGEVPAPVSVAVQVIVPAVCAFVAGWLTRHTPRPDLDSLAQVYPDPPGRHARRDRQP